MSEYAEEDLYRASGFVKMHLKGKQKSIRLGLFGIERLIMDKKINVFISYSWDDDEHKKWVNEFRERLISDGINAISDEVMNLGDRIMSFMEMAIAGSDYVLIICTPKYKEKADKRIGGVGYEGNIISNELYSRSNERKFIPVVRRGDYQTSLPLYCTGKNSADLTGNPYSEKEYSKLLSALKSNSLHSDIFDANKEYAENESNKYLKYESDKSGGILITGFTKELKGSFSIPKYINGDLVVAVNSDAFKNCTAIESIQLPSSITRIGSGAFFDCKNLKKIILSDKLSFIDDGVFYGCINLEEIIIPENVTRIGNSAFRGCRNLKSITIPSNVYSIGMWAFTDCHSLQDLTVKQGVCKIGKGAFYNCISLQYIYLPESLTFIDGWAFDSCTNLKCVNASRRCIVGESVFPWSAQIRTY